GGFALHRHADELRLIGKPDRVDVSRAIALDHEGLVERIGDKYFAEEIASSLCGDGQRQRYYRTNHDQEKGYGSPVNHRQLLSNMAIPGPASALPGPPIRVTALLDGGIPT